MKKLFVFVLFLGLLFSCAVEAQDAETTKIFGKNIGDVSNRPLFSRGLTLYKDGTLRFRHSSDYIYSPATDSIGITVGSLFFNSNDIMAGSGFWANSPSQASNDLSQAFFYTEDFMGVAIDSANGALVGGTSKAYSGTNANFLGWKMAGDAGAVYAQAAGTLGGVVTMVPATGSNNEYYQQMTEL